MGLRNFFKFCPFIFSAVSQARRPQGRFVQRRFRTNRRRKKRRRCHHRRHLEHYYIRRVNDVLIGIGGKDNFHHLAQFYGLPIHQFRANGHAEDWLSWTQRELTLLVPVCWTCGGWRFYNWKQYATKNLEITTDSNACEPKEIPCKIKTHTRLFGLLAIDPSWVWAILVKCGPG